MNIITPRLIIRDFTLDDSVDLCEVLSNQEVMKYIEHPFTMEQTKEFIKAAGLCEPPLVYALVYKETGKVIGHVIFHLYEEDSYEIGWIVHQDYWGIGIADEVTKALIEEAKNRNVNSLVIECDPEQVASKRIALKNHFIYDGEEDGCDVFRLVF